MLTLAPLTALAQGQATVTLAWDPSTSGGVAGYRVYEGGASRTYTNVITAGNVTAQSISGLVCGGTYFFAVTTLGTNGVESGFSAEVVFTVPLPTNTLPAIALSSPANGAAYTAPATINLAAKVTNNGHVITQVQFYNGRALIGTAVSAPYLFSWNNVSAGTYNLSAVAVYDSGGTVTSAAANVLVAGPRPSSGITFAADSGTFTAPFVDNGGTLSQPLLTGVANGGEAVYNFNLANGGSYVVSAMVIAPSLGENSFYVNIDAEPTDPFMIWDIPVCTTLTKQTVSWRGNGDSAVAQFVPMVFSLSAGSHRLIIRGREANTTLGPITISAAPPHLRIKVVASGIGTASLVAPPPSPSVILDVSGQPSRPYNVLCSRDLRTWTYIGSLTLDATGAGEFAAPLGANTPYLFYRLQAQ